MRRIVFVLVGALLCLGTTALLLRPTVWSAGGRGSAGQGSSIFNGGMAVCWSGDQLYPERVAAAASLIIKARVAQVEPARSVVGHPVVRSRRPGNYAWHDVLFDEVEVIWKDDVVPWPQAPVRVRVYSAQAPGVTFAMADQPLFVVGERYVLCLYEVDNFAFKVGPPHWRTVDGTFGAFLLQGDAVIRKGHDKKPFTTEAALRQELLKGALKDNAAEKGWKATQMHGIEF